MLNSLYIKICNNPEKCGILEEHSIDTVNVDTCYNTDNKRIEEYKKDKDNQNISRYDEIYNGLYDRIIPFIRDKILDDELKNTQLFTKEIKEKFKIILEKNNSLTVEELLLFEPKKPNSVSNLMNHLKNTNSTAKLAHAKTSSSLLHDKPTTAKPAINQTHTLAAAFRMMAPVAAAPALTPLNNKSNRLITTPSSAPPSAPGVIPNSQQQAMARTLASFHQ